MTDAHPDPHTVPVIASVSGGKDSTALSLWLTEQGIEHRRVFADTGWEHESTVEYVRDYLPGILGPIDVVRADLGMADLIQKKGMFPSGRFRYCTYELKVKPIHAYFAEVDPEAEAINAVGIRAQESLARSVLDEWEFDSRPETGLDRWNWRPLIGWSFDDVVAVHRRHNVTPNPLYLDGAERVGCYPCIYARKKEIAHLANRSPGRIDEIRALEEAVTAAARERNPDASLRTFFKSRQGATGIDGAVTWANTSHGGRQMEMFYQPAQDGCMRWGLCDSAGELDKPANDNDGSAGEDAA